LVAEERNELEGRIERLEQMLGSGMQREAIDLSADEIKTYIKVRDVIAANYGEFCGINDCFRCLLCKLCSSCQTCHTCATCRICRICDVECICSMGTRSGGMGDFMRFGG
jgi:hypothetical protein